MRYNWDPIGRLHKRFTISNGDKIILNVPQAKSSVFYFPQYNQKVFQIHVDFAFSGV